MSREVKTSIPDRKQLSEFLSNNPGIIFIKFGAEMEISCKKIENFMDEKFNSFDNHIQCAIIDIDECFDVYAYLKSKKIVSSIPSIVCYLKGNVSYVPDEVVCNSDTTEIEDFIQRCFDLIRGHVNVLIIYIFHIIHDILVNFVMFNYVIQWCIQMK